MKRAGGFMVGALIAACAMGTSTQQQQTDANGNHDGNSTPRDAPMTSGDAKVFHDAPVHPLDAFVPQDAPMGDGFCTDNTNCISTQCCFIAVCVDGTGVGTTLCFPS
jgi:hypothetical protein